MRNLITDNAFQLIAEESQLPIVVANSSEAIIFVNRAFRNLVSNNSGDIQLPSNLSSYLVDPPVGSLTESSLPSHPVGATLYEGSSIWRDSTGSSTSLPVKAILLSNEGDSFLICFYLGGQESTQDLDRQSALISEIGIKTGSIAHDLNNTLTGVLGHTSLLRFALGESHPGKSSLSAIDMGTRRACELAQELLQLGRAAPLTVEPTNLTAVMQNTIEIFRGTLPEKIQCDVISPEGDLTVNGHAGSLDQLLLNLLTNARDSLQEISNKRLLNTTSTDFAAPQGQGGRITVTLRRACEEDLPTPSEHDHHFSHRTTLPAALLTVEDTGSGIPQHIRDKIFEPFFTTKGVQGTGLGLSIVASVIQSHSGTLVLSSKEGKGTTFRIFLPLLEEKKTDAPSNKHTGNQSQPAVAPKRSSVEMGSGEKLLVVDDEPSVRIVLQRSLEHLGYAVDAAENASQALDLYATHPNDYRLVIMDMIMPGMSGDELFKRLKEKNPKVAVLISSGYSSDKKTKEILASGGLGFIQKPFAIEELAREVARCLRLEPA